MAQPDGVLVRLLARVSLSEEWRDGRQALQLGRKQRSASQCWARGLGLGRVRGGERVPGVGGADRPFQEEGEAAPGAVF